MATNPFRDSWLLAREHGIKKDVWAKSIGVSRGMADDLTAGRRKPSLGQVSALSTKQRSWLVRYRDNQGGYHGFYVGRGKSLDELTASGAIEGIMVEQVGDSPQPGQDADMLEPEDVVSIEPKYPRFPSRVRIYATKPGGIHKWRR